MSKLTRALDEFNGGVIKKSEIFFAREVAVCNVFPNLY